MEGSENISISFAGWLIIIGILIILLPIIGAAGKFLRRQLVSLGLTLRQSTFITVILFTVLGYLIFYKTSIVEMLQQLVS